MFKKGLSWFKGSWLDGQGEAGPRDLEAERWRDRMFTAETGMTPMQFDEAARTQFLEKMPPPDMPEPGGTFKPGAITGQAPEEAPADIPPSTIGGSFNPRQIAGAGPGPGLKSVYEAMRERFRIPSTEGPAGRPFAGFGGRAPTGEPSPDDLAAELDAGQRFNKRGQLVPESTPEPAIITPEQEKYRTAFRRLFEPGGTLESGNPSAPQPAAPAAPKPTTAQVAVDRAYGKDYADYQAGGGFADVGTQIASLEKVLGELRSGKGNLTGPLVSALPDAVRSRAYPGSVSAQQAVEQSIQRALRQTLGAQFTEKEGEAFMKRGYDPRLPERENVKKLESMLNSLKTMARAKQDAIEYFEKNGSLVGYKGKAYALKNGEMVEAGTPSRATPSAETKNIGGVTYERTADGWVRR